jgi:ABC-type Mn2+/Zn2+ transport system permease subunit
VAPPVAAMLLMKNVRSIFIASVAIGAVSPIIGLFLAFEYDFPSSPAIVAVASVILGVSWLVNMIKRS